MKIYQANLSQGIGDNIMSKCYADQAFTEGKVDKIYFTHHAPIVEKQKNNSPEYWKFLHELGNLFFTTHPYIYNNGQFPFKSAEGLIADFGIIPQKPQRSVYVPLLCKGNLLNLNQEYIVITTKLRYFERRIFNTLAPQLWATINKLSNRYKIVVLGERTVEMCPDYLWHGANKIYGIYNEIMQNIPHDRMVDLTIPALGITAPTLSQIQQDCLIMSEAKFVITLGIGGNFCMAMAVSNMIGFRIDNEPISDAIFSKSYPDATVVKDWNTFIRLLEGQL